MIFSREDNQESVEEIFNRFGSLLYRNSIIILRNTQDAEDIVQDTLLKYMEHKKEFRDDEHKKAWLLRVNINLCKNKLRYNRFHAYVPLEQLEIPYETNDEKEIMEAVLNLPHQYKEVILLHYVEGYQVNEISEIMKLTESAVKKRLQRAREKLADKTSNNTSSRVFRVNVKEGGLES